MPAKRGGRGGKNRRRGRGDMDGDSQELSVKEDGQEYAVVVRMLGNGRLEAKCFDGKTRLGHIRGKMRKKVWVNQGDIVLVGLRDFQDEKCDVIQKYSPEEARRLKADGHLPETTRIGDANFTGDAPEEEDCPFDFDDI